MGQGELLGMVATFLAIIGVYHIMDYFLSLLQRFIFWKWGARWSTIPVDAMKKEAIIEMMADETSLTCLFDFYLSYKLCEDCTRFLDVGRIRRCKCGNIIAKTKRGYFIKFRKR